MKAAPFDSSRAFLIAIGLGISFPAAAQDSTIILPPAANSPAPAEDPNSGVTVDWGALDPSYAPPPAANPPEANTPADTPADAAAPAGSAPTPPPAPETMPESVPSPSEMVTAAPPPSPSGNPPAATPMATNAPMAAPNGAAAPVADPAANPAGLLTSPPEALPADGSVSAITANSLTLDYPPRQDEIPAAAESALRNLVANLEADPSLRLLIVATASGSEDEAAKAERKSLARALALRTYFHQAGITADRIEVHALGLGLPALIEEPAPAETPPADPNQPAESTPAPAPVPAIPSYLTGLPGGDSVTITLTGS